MSLRELIVAVTEALFGPRIEAGVAYRARVEAQRSSGALDVVPESTRLPRSLTNVPIRYGLPGCSAKVRKDAIVFVEFVEGDRARPIVTGWESGSVTELVVSADLVKLAGGNRAVALEGTPVAVFITAVDAGNISKLMASGGAGAVPLSGYILQGGSSKVKASS